MRPIKMVDLSAQYTRIQQEVDSAIAKVLASGEYIQGSAVQTFASNLAEYTGAAYVIPCANGTDAIQIALMSLNLQEGDEVIIPAFTYVATAEAIALLKLTPVPVDVDPQTFNMNPDLLDAAISSKTKAIIPVHLFGQSCDMEKIMKIARKNNLYVIEDNAQSIGSSYTFADGSKKQTGTMGDMGVLSFFPTKNLGCYGDGGAILTNNEKLAQRAQMIASHGQSAKYHHEVIGCNSRLDTLQAAALNVKLNYLNDYIKRRRVAANFYYDELAEIDLVGTPFISSASTHVYHQFTLIVKNDERDALRQYLATRDIPTMIYYPVPVHKQPAFKGLIRFGSLLNTSESLCNSVLSLPMHTELDREQQEYITTCLIDFANK